MLANSAQIVKNLQHVQGQVTEARLKLPEIKFDCQDQSIRQIFSSLENVLYTMCDLFDQIITFDSDEVQHNQVQQKEVQDSADTLLRSIFELRRRSDIDFNDEQKIFLLSNPNLQDAFVNLYQVSDSLIDIYTNSVRENHLSFFSMGNPNPDYVKRLDADYKLTSTLMNRKDQLIKLLNDYFFKDQSETRAPRNITSPYSMRSTDFAAEQRDVDFDRLDYLATILEPELDNIVIDIASQGFSFRETLNGQKDLQEFLTDIKTVFGCNWSLANLINSLDHINRYEDALKTFIDKLANVKLDKLDQALKIILTYSELYKRSNQLQNTLYEVPKIQMKSLLEYDQREGKRDFVFASLDALRYCYQQAYIAPEDRANLANDDREALEAKFIDIDDKILIHELRHPNNNFTNFINLNNFFEKHENALKAIGIKNFTDFYDLSLSKTISKGGLVEIVYQALDQAYQDETLDLVAMTKAIVNLTRAFVSSTLETNLIALDSNFVIDTLAYYPNIQGDSAEESNSVKD